MSCYFHEFIESFVTADTNSLHYLQSGPKHNSNSVSVNSMKQIRHMAFKCTVAKLQHFTVFLHGFWHLAQAVCQINKLQLIHYYITQQCTIRLFHNGSEYYFNHVHIL